MSRTGVDGVVGNPKIPNMQALAVPANIRPRGVDGHLESGGTSVENRREVNSAEVLTPGGFKGSAVTGHNSDKGIKARRYRVVKEGSYKPRNSPEKYKMNEGKVLDDANYDIKDLRSQGIKIVEIDEDDNEIRAGKRE